MGRFRRILKCAVTALLMCGVADAGVTQEIDELEALFEGLKSAEAAEAAQIEDRIYNLWSQSGSPSMDMLLERGREALAEGDAKTAVQHFTALIDHAPDFAEGYNGRATAYFQMGRFGPSMEDIRQTLVLNPRHFGAMSGLALIFEELGMTDGSLTVWREVREMHPNREGLDEAIKRLERKVDGETL